MNVGGYRFIVHKLCLETLAGTGGSHTPLCYECGSLVESRGALGSRGVAPSGPRHSRADTDGGCK